MSRAGVATPITDSRIRGAISRETVGRKMYPFVIGGDEDLGGLTTGDIVEWFRPYGDVRRYGVTFSPANTVEAEANADALQKALHGSKRVTVEGGDLGIYRSTAVPGAKIPSNRHLILKPGSSITRYATWEHVMLVNEDWDTGTGTNANENITIECEEGAFFDDGGFVAGVGDILAFGHAQHLKFINVTGKNNYWHVIDLAGCADALVYGGYFPAGASNINGSEVQCDTAIAGAIVGINADSTPTTDVRVRSSVFENASHSGVHIHRTGCKRISVRGCQFNACERAFKVDNDIDAEDVVFSDNQINEPIGTGSGSPVIQQQGRITNLEICNNQAHTTTDAQYFAWIDWNSTLRTVGCQFNNNTIRGFSYAARFEEVWRLTITGNIIDPQSSLESLPYALKLNNCKGFTLTGNYISGSSIVAFVGVDLAGICLRGVVANNTLVDCATGITGASGLVKTTVGPNEIRDCTVPLNLPWNEKTITRMGNAVADSGWLAIDTIDNDVTVNWALGSPPVGWEIVLAVADPIADPTVSLQPAGLVYDGTGWIGTVATGVSAAGCTIRTGDQGVAVSMSSSGIVSPLTTGWARVRAWS